MPITKAAKKELRKNKIRKERNLVKKRQVKLLERKTNKLVRQGKTEEAKELLPQLYENIDKAVKSNIIAKNTAARKKSKMARKVNEASSQAPKTTKSSKTSTKTTKADKTTASKKTSKTASGSSAKKKKK